MVLETVFLLTITACIAAGVTGALVATWQLRVRVLSLELALETVKTDLVSEVKRRAGQTPKKRDEVEDLLTKLGEKPGAALNHDTRPWWARTDHVQK